MEEGDRAVEARAHAAVRDELSERGHRVQDEETWSSGVSHVCAITVDPETGMRVGGADPRGACYTIGW